MTLVGQNLGRIADEAATHGWTAFTLGCVVMSGMGLLFFVLAPEMFQMFCSQPGQEEVVTEGVRVLRCSWTRW